MRVNYGQPYFGGSDDGTTAIATPPDTVIDDDDCLSAVPHEGATFILRSKSCGRFLTTQPDGQVSLTEQYHAGYSQWECVRTDGWLGLCNVFTRKFLGHKGYSATFQCWVSKHNWWEMFQVQPIPDGGYILLTSHWGSAWHVAMQDTKSLRKANPSDSKGVVWQFIEIDPESE